ncbi:apolipoprotein A1/A4/E family protein [Lutibacter sp. A64]|uniref:apolipoprotein A1/A4/E family protein n=1 Tax=Lutibacter sp. A64 TaxID=2918526 RepID=UPI001F059C61|nr:apolipoprotein A1/A4/E family protein [Lutibacter sp. A64]UMB52564.1 apolipoprotein A1/A4/E family protein [Lutibacter sp. A64]
MNKYLFKIKYIVLVTFVSLTSCVNDDLADVGDLEDITGPTPFYNVTDITTSEFDCSDVELEANYEFNFQAGSNLAVNGIYYEWKVSPSEGIELINKDLPILEKSIEGELATVTALEDAISKLEFKLPCTVDEAKAAVLEAQIADLEAQLETAKASLTDETLQNVSNLESQIATLPAATLQDREIIVSFPGPGEYTVGLTVTDNLGKSDYIEKTITVNQVVPTIPIPEIGEPSFDDGTLFDGTGDGRDSWRAPSSSKWGSVFQINTKSELGVLPDGYQAAKFPSDGSRVGYQEIEVTPGATYVLTYFSELDTNNIGEVTVSIISPNATTLDEAKLEANIIASRTESSVGRVDDVFKKHAITFEAGEYEKVIILLTNSGTECRLDAFDITVKQ